LSSCYTCQFLLLAKRKQIKTAGTLASFSAEVSVLLKIYIETGKAMQMSLGYINDDMVILLFAGRELFVVQ